MTIYAGHFGFNGPVSLARGSNGPAMAAAPEIASALRRWPPQPGDDHGVNR